MKFIIRDDDVNAWFKPDQLASWYKDIIDICPMSICAVPFIKGEYFKWVHLAVTDKDECMARKDEFYDDDKIYPFGDNHPLIELIKGWEKSGKAKVSMHGIHHRNWNRNAPDIANNYSTGAEFWTDKDMTEPLKHAKDYLSSVIGRDIKWFTAPQNLISEQSYRALRNAGFNINSNYYNLRNFKDCSDKVGFLNYIKLFSFRIFQENKMFKYPYVVNHKGCNLLTYYAGLYPNGVNLETIKKQMSFVYSKNGVFVFNTHSFGFDDILPQCGNMTVKEALIELLEYSKGFNNIEYLTLEEL